MANRAVQNIQRVILRKLHDSAGPQIVGRNQILAWLDKPEDAIPAEAKNSLSAILKVMITKDFVKALPLGDTSIVLPRDLEKHLKDNGTIKLEIGEKGFERLCELE